MLRTGFLQRRFKIDVKAGLYVDLWARRATQYTIQNGLVWAALYVAEKLIIEYATRGRLSVGAATPPRQPYATLLQACVVWGGFVALLGAL